MRVLASTMASPTFQNALHAGSQLLQQGSVGRALAFLSSHTGLPVTLVASGFVVASFRMLRRASSVLIEVGVVMAALAGMTHLGWISW